MNRYENGKVYMIESASAGLIYYGSTCMPLAKRLHAHREGYKRYQNGKSHFVTSYKVLDFEDHKIVLVEEVECANKQQLLAREAHYIRTTECVNKKIPGRTIIEYHQDNKQMLSEKQRQYNEANKEIILEKNKLKITCVCGSTLRKKDILRHNKTTKHQTSII